MYERRQKGRMPASRMCASAHLQLQRFFLPTNSRLKIPRNIAIFTSSTVVSLQTIQ